MSFGDRPPLTGWQKVGCALYAIFGGFIAITAMGSAALGDCVPGENCISETGRAILFYGVPLAVIMGGALLTRHFMRDKH